LKFFGRVDPGPRLSCSRAVPYDSDMDQFLRSLNEEDEDLLSFARALPCDGVRDRYDKWTILRLRFKLSFRSNDVSSSSTIAEVVKGTRRLRYEPVKSLAPFIPYIDKGLKTNSETRVIDDEWIDLDSTIRSWLRRCDECHAGHCFRVNEEHQSRDRTRPMWLIYIQAFP